MNKSKLRGRENEQKKKEREGGKEKGETPRNMTHLNLLTF